MNEMDLPDKDKLEVEANLLYAAIMGAVGALQELGAPSELSSALVLQYWRVMKLYGIV